MYILITAWAKKFKKNCKDYLSKGSYLRRNLREFIQRKIIIYKKKDMRSLLRPINILLLSLIVFVGCSEITGSEENEEENENDSPSLEAVIDYSPQNPETDTQVTLDASNSGDDQGIGYEVQWSLESKPSNSSATIQNATSVQATFTPDLEGDYEILLEINNDSEGVSDSETATVSAVEGNPTEEISGEMNENTTLENHVEDPEVPDYLVVGDVGVNAELTIEPGVIIHFEEDRQLNINSDGTLLAAGEASNKIIFTSADAEGGRMWKGIQIVSTDARNEISNAEINYAGNSEFGGFSNFVDVPAAIALHSDGKLNLNNTDIKESGGYGLYSRYGTFESFVQNNFENNALAGIGLNANEVHNIDGATTFSGNERAVEIYGSTLSLTSDAVWSKLDGTSRYYVSGNVGVSSFLEISAGAKFDFAEDVKLKVNNDGALKAVGTSSEKIEFTSAKSSSGIYWKGLELTSSDARNELTHTVISYAGNSEFGSFSDFVDKKTALAMYNDARLTLTQTEISNSDGYGVYVRYGTFDNFAENTFSSNTLADIGLQSNQVKSIDANTTFSDNGNYAVEVYDGDNDLSEESTWVNLSNDASYHIITNIDVTTGLTVNPGALLEFDEDVFLTIADTGYLIAEGTSSNPIVMTTSNEAGQIRWAGIGFFSADARNSLDYVTVNYAGGAEHGSLDDFEDPVTAVAGNINAQLSITNSTISNSGGYGVYFQGAGTINDIESSAASNTFTNNPDGNSYSSN